jgi:3-hydroxyacyl-CoA dehydrogenase / enoyl-CoA hydratase / 3-hydroxybutyryl-CoA epimerase
MTKGLPELTQFRIEPQANGLVHLVFDCPDRSMNVFSNTAIHELGAFAEWLHHAEVRGVVVRSGKSTGFCAGADLTELGVAYDMIVAAPQADRFDIAFGHFFALSHAIRRLETAGKPVAAAITGVALGGGCELALGCHYRVTTTSPRAMLGLPECAVGLLPGAGGTQRMPRLVGVEVGLEILLQGRNLHGQDAVDAGLIHAVVDEGREVSAAEAWLLSDAAHCIQPWDRAEHYPLAHGDYGAVVEAHRTRELTRMLGHEPAPLAILDCVELGLMQPFDGAIRSEMSVFARLIQRPEPRNMIRTMFLGKQAWDKARRDCGISEEVELAATRVAAAVTEACARSPALRRAGLLGGEGAAVAQRRAGEGFWLDGQPELREGVIALGAICTEFAAELSLDQQLQLDHCLASQAVIPAYLGGLTGLLALRSKTI